MDTRRIGSLETTIIGLGCNNFGMRIDENASRAVIDAALDAGITFFDTADSYRESEEFIGRALKGRRDQVVLATKFGSRVNKEIPGGAAPDYIRSAVERSLTLLQTDHIDLYQLHKPDPSSPIAETLGALDGLVKAGKVIEIGCSNFSAAQLDEAAGAVAPDGAAFASVQNDLSLLKRDDEAEALPWCAAHGVAHLPYFPLASGVLTGKYQSGTIPDGSRVAAWGLTGLVSPENLAYVDRLSAWAGDHGHSITELAFAWLLAKDPVASVIAGATSVAQIAANAAGANWTLSSAQVAEIDAIARPG